MEFIHSISGRYEQLILDLGAPPEDPPELSTDEKVVLALLQQKITAEGLVEKAEELVTDEATTDAVLDAAANAAKKVTGRKLDDKIDATRNVLDDKIGE